MRGGLVSMHCEDRIGTKGLWSWVIFILLGATIFIPRVSAGGLSLGIDDLITPILLLILFVPVAFWPQKTTLLTNKLFVVWILVLIHGVILGIFSTFYYMDQFIFPTEMWQYARRLGFFFFSFYVAWAGILSAKRVFVTLLVLMILAAIVGILQAIPGNFLGIFFAELFARNESHYSLAVERTMGNLRVFGVAGMSISWGGFCSFGAALSLYPLVGKYHKSDVIEHRYVRLLSLACFVLCVANVVLSGSRGALLSLFSVVVFALIFAIFFMKNKFYFIRNIFVAIAVISFLIYFLFYDRIEFFIYRIGFLLSDYDDEVGRVDQVILALDIYKESIYSMIFGIGNAFQRINVRSFGTEVEPIYILVNYGISGFILRYMLIVLVFKSSFDYFMREKEFYGQLLAVATLYSLISYMVFSTGYFFFQEIYVGTFPWLLYGWTAGACYRPYCSIAPGDEL